MKILALIPLFVCFIVSCMRESPGAEFPSQCSAPIDTTFIQTVQQETLGSADSMAAIIRTAPGEYIIAGMSYEGFGNSEISVFKTDLCSNTTPILNSPDISYAVGLCPSWKEGVVSLGYLSGWLSGLAGRVIVQDVKDTSGQGEIQATYDGGPYGASGYDIKQLEPDLYVVGGRKVFEKQFGFGISGYVLILNKDLEHIKTVKFEDRSIVHAVLPMANSQIACLGDYTVSGEDLLGLWIIDSDGTILLERSFTFNNLFGVSYVGASHATMSNEGNILLTGFYHLGAGTPYQSFVMELNSNGDVVNEMEFGGLTDEIMASNRPSKIIQTSDGGFLIVGSHQDSNTNSDVYFLKIDENLQYEWDRSYGGPEPDYASDVIEEENGDFVVVGSTRSNLNLSLIGGYMIKTDKHGNVY